MHVPSTEFLHSTRTLWWRGACISSPACIPAIIILKTVCDTADPEPTESPVILGLGSFSTWCSGAMPGFHNQCMHTGNVSFSNVHASREPVRKLTEYGASLRHSNIQGRTCASQLRNRIEVERERPARSIAQINSRLFELFGSMFTFAILFQQVCMPVFSKIQSSRS
jgi:hypothetical protein